MEDLRKPVENKYGNRRVIETSQQNSVKIEKNEENVWELEGDNKCLYILY